MDIQSMKGIASDLLSKDTPDRAFSAFHKSYIRDHLPPTRVVTLNGVEVKHDRPLDKYSLFVNSGDNPEYERILVSYIRFYAEAGDTAVVVGGGWGVSAVVTARQVGDSGHVHTYEAGQKQAKFASETVERNNVGGWCDVYHAAVGSTVGAFNAPKNADHISGQDLPDADLLIVDCDGAEFQVLESISNAPERLIVEHHAVDNSSGEIVVEYQPDRVEEKLLDMGYSVKESNEEEHRLDKNAHWVGVR
jgi:hypothetical protein